jgi:hypothetical protein
MRAIHLLVFFAVILISSGGCKNKAAKNSVNCPAEEFYNESLPGELQKFESIKFISSDGSDKIWLTLQDPQETNSEYLPSLVYNDHDYLNNIDYKGYNASTWQEDGKTCYAINFEGRDNADKILLKMVDDLPAELYWDCSDFPLKSFKVAQYTTFDIYTGNTGDEPDKYFDSALTELEQKSSRIEKIPQGIKNLVPSNSELYFCAMGDLNRDKYNDAIMITGNDHIERIECWILTGTSDNSYKISAVNDNIGLYADYFDDKSDFEYPLFDIVIKNGGFTIEILYGVSENGKEIHTAHLKYSKEDNNWLLFRSDFVSNRFLIHDCCYDCHLTKYFVKKIPFESLSTIYF